MNRSFILSGMLLGCCSLITACDSGGGGGGNTLTGVFVDGPVQGLSYETATRSGLTNAAGQFSYRAGETVTFSIGGIELGSAPGAAQLDPFDLVGMTPPAAELALRLELNTRNDVTDFDRAANIAFLLVSLDNDANPDNGLDITGWDSALAGVDLDLDVNLYKFAKKFRRFAGQHDINPNVTPMRPLAHLYQSLGITVPINLLDRINHDFDNDGTLDSVVDYSFNARGQLIARTIDNAANGFIDASISYTYTADGRAGTNSEVSDDDDDGAPDFGVYQTFAYNSNGDYLSLLYELDNDGDGNPDGSSTGINHYNDLGDRVSELILVDNENNGITDYSIEQEYTYDTNGDLVMRVFEVDNGHNGSVDDKSIYEYTYDATGNLLSWQVDEYGNDNTIDLTWRELNTYNAAGNLLTKTSTRDDDGAGPGAISYSEFTTNTYDGNGNLSTSLFEERDNGLVPSFRELTTHTYNGDGTLLMSSVRDIDSNFDGLFDDYRITSTYTYGAHGNWLTQLYQTDSDGDGDIDATSSSVHQYTVLNDGMFGLLYHYLDTGVVNN